MEYAHVHVHVVIYCYYICILYKCTCIFQVTGSWDLSELHVHVQSSDMSGTGEEPYDLVSKGEQKVIWTGEEALLNCAPQVAMTREGHEVGRCPDTGKSELDGLNEVGVAHSIMGWVWHIALLGGCDT